jgi:hypothetical protein
MNRLTGKDKITKIIKITKITKITKMKKIICLLAVKPCEKTYNFYKNIQLNSDYDVYIVLDDVRYQIPGDDGTITVIRVESVECKSKGFHSTIKDMQDIVSSRDKALYYFRDVSFDCIWILEEDVFVPSINTIIDIDNNYSGDLLVERDTDICNTIECGWHWRLVQHKIKIPPPYSKGMICSVRCSKQLLTYIGDYAATYNTLFIDEALFHTLSLQNNLKITAVPEMETIVFKNDWRKEDIKSTNLYHPVKNINQQYEFREYLKIN